MRTIRPITSARNIEVWGFIRNLLVIIGFLSAFTIAEMILDAHDEGDRAAPRVELVRR